MGTLEQVLNRCPSYSLNTAGACGTNCNGFQAHNLADCGTNMRRTADQSVFPHRIPANRRRQCDTKKVACHQKLQLNQGPEIMKTGCWNYWCPYDFISHLFCIGPSCKIQLQAACTRGRRSSRLLEIPLARLPRCGSYRGSDHADPCCTDWPSSLVTSKNWILEQL